MNLNLSDQQLEELKDLIQYSLSEISSEIRHSHAHQIKDELKKKKDDLFKILTKIESERNQKAA